MKQKQSLSSLLLPPLLFTWPQIPSPCLLIHPLLGLNEQSTHRLSDDCSLGSQWIFKAKHSTWLCFTSPPTGLSVFGKGAGGGVTIVAQKKTTTPTITIDRARKGDDFTGLAMSIHFSFFLSFPFHSPSPSPFSRDSLDSYMNLHSDDPKEREMDSRSAFCFVAGVIINNQNNGDNVIIGNFFWSLERC